MNENTKKYKAGILLSAMEREIKYSSIPRDIDVINGARQHIKPNEHELEYVSHNERWKGIAGKHRRDLIKDNYLREIEINKKKYNSITEDGEKLLELLLSET